MLHLVLYKQKKKQLFFCAMDFCHWELMVNLEHFTFAKLILKVARRSSCISSDSFF